MTRLTMLMFAFVSAIAMGTADAGDAELLAKARAGDINSMRIVARKLYEGRGIRRDVTNAVAWWKKAAEAHDPVSCNILGDLYRDGAGVRKNLDKAYAYYRLAHKYGSDKAEARIAKLPAQYGNHFRKHKSFDYDPDEVGDFHLSEEMDDDDDDAKPAGKTPAKTAGQQAGKKLDKVAKLRKKAEQGDAMAQYKLGMMYNEGDGVPKDRQEALKWLRKAEAQGNPYAKEYIQGME